jgi:hypothetical protein
MNAGSFISMSIASLAAAASSRSLVERRPAAAERRISRIALFFRFARTDQAVRRSRTDRRLSFCVSRIERHPERILGARLDDRRRRDEPFGFPAADQVPRNVMDSPVRAR